MNGWDPETNSFCLHNEEDLGVTLTRDVTGIDYVQPFCENCYTLLGNKSQLFKLVAMAADRAHEEGSDEITVEDILADEILAIAIGENMLESMGIPEEEEEEGDHEDQEGEPA